MDSPLEAVLADLARQVVIPALPTQGSSAASTGNIVWDGRAGYGTAEDIWGGHGHLLSFLDRLHCRGGIRGKRILSLGVGRAVMEIALACAGAHVVATDLPHCTVLIDDAIAANAKLLEKWRARTAGTIAVHGLDWREPLPDTLREQHFDIILCSDCVFWPGLFRPLVQTLSSLCPRGSGSGSRPHAFFAVEARHARELAFFSMLADAGFTCRLIDDTVEPLLPRAGSSASAVFWLQRR